jgi:hypothetical protein
MRDATPLETPSLFTPELLNGNESLNVVAIPEKSADIVAREFVRWCWSFGNDFHNSPDITNLRSWLQKERLSPSASEEEEILVEARRLFLKRVEQAVRKADVPREKD